MPWAEAASFAGRYEIIWFDCGFQQALLEFLNSRKSSSVFAMRLGRLTGKLISYNPLRTLAAA
jgi:hypothetical protein